MQKFTLFHVYFHQTGEEGKKKKKKNHKNRKTVLFSKRFCLPVLMSRLYIFRNLLTLEKTCFHFQQLGLLRCGDTMVFYALKERLHRDNDQRVCYEATKSLILIGETIPWLTCCVFICVWSTLSLIVVSDGIGQFYMFVLISYKQNVNCFCFVFCFKFVKLPDS